jgi:hypothetical protein
VHRVDRDARLYGGFVEYGYATERNDFLRNSIEAMGADSALEILPESRMGVYFDRSSADRFIEWCGYKVSLVVPLKRDLSQRFFDALLAGQIPLVPYEMGDFDEVIPKDLQASLPVYRFSMGDIDSLHAAYRQAIASFDRDGAEGTVRRHRFALDGHLFDNRVERLLDRLLTNRPAPDVGPFDGTKAAGSSRPALPAGMLPRPVVSARPKLFIDAQHGIGNRLRAIASAAAIARATDRELVVVWQPDCHCEGRFADLFDYPGAVVEEAFVDDAQARGLRVYNYMEVERGAEKNAPIDLAGHGDIYARSAYVLNAPQTNWQAENAFLRSLTPVAEVLELVRGVRSPNDLSAHVRMEGGAAYAHLPYESSENWTEEGHAEIESWRHKSHYSRFVTRIQQLIEQRGIERLFVAADLPETYDAFVEAFGERVAYLRRDIYDRSAEQLRYALADAMLLGRSPLLLGSNWSSFSEIAMRLAPQPMSVELSGRDF